MSNQKRIKAITAYDAHSLLDYCLVECAVSNRSIGKQFTIPYKNVLAEGQDPQYAESQLKVEILVHWDGKLTAPKNAIVAEPSKKKH